ncbi:MAG: STAS domain-containing protein [Acidimicrobiales bacterium]
MALVQPPSTPRSRQTEATIITLTGEHDVATLPADNELFAIAIASSHSDIVVDLSGVDFMSAATVDLIVGIRRLLAAQSRMLTLRSPSNRAKRILDLCGVA